MNTDFNVFLKKKNIFFYIIDAYFNNITKINAPKFIEINDQHFLDSIQLIVDHYYKKNKTFVINNKDGQSILEYMLNKYSKIKSCEKINFTIFSQLFMLYINHKLLLNEIFKKINFKEEKEKEEKENVLLSLLSQKKYMKMNKYYKLYVESLINHEFILYLCNLYTPYYEFRDEINETKGNGSIYLYSDITDNTDITDITDNTITEIKYDYININTKKISKGISYDSNKKKFFSYHAISDKDTNYSEEYIANLNEEKENINLVKIFNDEMLFYGNEIMVLINGERFEEKNLTINTRKVKIIMGSKEIKNLENVDKDKLINLQSEDIIKTLEDKKISLISIEIEIKNWSYEYIKRMFSSWFSNKEDKEDIDHKDIRKFRLYFEQIIVDMIFLKTCIDMKYHYKNIKKKYETFIICDIIYNEDDDKLFIDSFNNSEILNFEDSKTKKYIELFNSIEKVENITNFKKIHVSTVKNYIDIIKHKKINEYKKKLEIHKEKLRKLVSSNKTDTTIDTPPLYPELAENIPITTKDEHQNILKFIKELRQDETIIKSINEKFPTKTIKTEKSDTIYYNDLKYYPYVLYGIGVINKYLKLNNIGYLIIHGGSAIKFYNNDYDAEDVDVKFFPINKSLSIEVQKEILNEYYNIFLNFLSDKIRSKKIENKFINNTIKLLINGKSIFETYLYNKDDPYFTLYNDILKIRGFKHDTETHIPDATEFEDTGLLFLNKELLIMELLIKIHSPEKIIIVKDETKGDVKTYIQNKAKNQLKKLVENYTETEIDDLISLLLTKSITIYLAFAQITEHRVSDGKKKKTINSTRKKRNSVRKTRKSVRNSVRKTRKSVRKTRKSVRNSVRKTRKSVRNSVRKTRNSVRKTRKSRRK